MVRTGVVKERAQRGVMRWEGVGWMRLRWKAGQGTHGEEAGRAVEGRGLG